MTKTISLTLENPITMLGRKLAKRKISKLSKQIEKRQEKIAKLNSKYFKNDSTTKQETKTIATKLEKINQKTYRYFLRDDTKKGVMSAQIAKIAGKKATWKRAGKNQDKDWFIKAIGSKSDNVGIVMEQLPNMEKYFNKSPYVAKFWGKTQ